MSTQEIRNPITYVRQSRRRKMIEVGSNVPHSHASRVQGQRTEILTHTASQIGTNVQQEGSMPQVIDVEAYDDDVTLSSPREFAEAKAKNNSRRSRRRTVLIDLESEGQSTRTSTHNLLNLALVAEESSRPVNKNSWSMKMAPPLPQPPPVEPTFTCPVCMGPYVEEMSTKCGHIFCKKCIRASIAVRGKCPTCRGKISMKNTIRVYLPATK
ncbi:hypothetical protein ACET3Z_012946 [Daucus carota]